MKRTARSLQLLNFAVTLREQDDFFFCEFSQLKKYITRKDLIKIIRLVKSNPSCKVDDGLTYVYTEDNGYVYNVQWSF